MALGPPAIFAALGLFALLAGSKKSTVPPGATAPPLSTNEMPDAQKLLIARAIRDMGFDETGNVKPPVKAEAVQAATVLASQLESQGFYEAAAQLREYVKRAAVHVATPGPSQSIIVPGITPELQEKLNKALMLERDPAKLRAIAAALKALPASAQRDLAISTLEEIANQVEVAQKTAKAIKEIEQVIVSPGIPQPGGGTTPTTPVTLPQEKTKELIVAESVQTHLKRLQANANGDPKKVKGKEDTVLVKRFQAQEGLTTDGKAGPGLMKQLAKYVGDLPLVMYWPTSANKNNVLQYRHDLNDLASVADLAGDKARAAALRVSASRERGQAGIVGPMPA